LAEKHTRYGHPDKGRPYLFARKPMKNKPRRTGKQPHIFHAKPRKTYGNEKGGFCKPPYIAENPLIVLHLRELKLLRQFPFWF